MEGLRRLLAAALLIALFSCFALAEGAGRAPFRIELPGQSAVPGQDADADQLFGAYAARFFYGRKALLRKRVSLDGLEPLERGLYSVLAPQIALVASGERTSTEFTVTLEEAGVRRRYSAADLGLETLWDGSDVSEEAMDEMKNYTAFSLGLLLDALMANHPYELYWYDKTERTYCQSVMIGVAYDDDLGDYVLEIVGDFVFSFPVASAYAADTYKTSAAAVNAAKTAAANAKAIVKAHGGKSDLDKLSAYRDEILSLVSYNYSAANDASAPYGDPWQLIWVFDGDSSTNVVCEGYSKAFQYLCDSGSFASGKVNCISVSGVMSGGTGAGDHMWNVVTLPDGRNYLADVTNSDSDSAGYDGSLFLKPYTSRSSSGTYSFRCPGKTIRYSYDSDTLRLYSESELEISDSEYVPSCAAGHTPVTDEAVEATCAQTGLTEGSHCDVCGEILTAQQIVEKKPHTPVTDEAVEATCAQTGLTEGSHCDVCGEILTAQQIIEKKPHTPVTDEAVEATCAQTGLTEGSHCSACGEVIKAQEIIEKKPHTLVTDEAVEATCTQTGLTEGSHCSVCGEVFKAQEVIEKKPHTPVTDEAVEATCAQTGLTE
ncbi:MAG: hypothetical protein IKE30_06470, partial [Clostridia bacterium]|nr:hypothetical protein [Clostridia bacterium]